MADNFITEFRFMAYVAKRKRSEMYKVFVKNTEGNRHLGNLDTDGTLMLKCYLTEQILKLWIRWSWFIVNQFLWTS
jgi:hypothetical protein